MSEHDGLIKRLQPYYSDLPSGGMMVLDEMVNAIRDLEVKFDNQHTHLVGARMALEQIAIVCTDNMDRDKNHRMALDFVRQIANSALPGDYREETK